MKATVRTITIRDSARGERFRYRVQWRPSEGCFHVLSVDTGFRVWIDPSDVSEPTDRNIAIAAHEGGAA